MTLLILAAAMYGFVRKRLAPDVTSLLALLALLLTGVLTPYEAFSGFSHPATISVAAVLVLSAGVERTGALTYIARRLLTPIGNRRYQPLKVVIRRNHRQSRCCSIRLRMISEGISRSRFTFRRLHGCFKHPARIERPNVYVVSGKQPCGR